MGDAQHKTMTQAAIKWLLAKIKKHTHTYIKSQGRLKSANHGSSGDRRSALEMFLASSDMTEGKPPNDACVLQMNWDSDDKWDTQLALSTTGNPHAYLRGQNNGAWSAWRTLLDSHNWMEYASSKPVLTKSSSGEWFRFTLRLPDIKMQVSWMYWGTSQVITTASGSIFESKMIDMGNWEKAFNSLHAFFYSVGVDETMDRTDCWLSCYRSANKNQAGSYYIKRNSSLSASRKYWIYVVGIGTYDE